MRINPWINQVQSPPITEVASWVAGRNFPPDKPLIDLCQAVPGYPPPAELAACLREALLNPDTFKYTPDEGLPGVREEVAAWYRRWYRAGPAPEQMCLTLGASQAFWLALTGLCQPGDEVIVQLPAYFDHLMGLQSLGLRPVYAAYNPATGGQPDPEEIRNLVSKRTRAILLVSPSNPTGAVTDAETLTALLQLAQEHELALIVDETYNSFIGSVPHDLFCRDNWPDSFIHLASFGKTFAMTGLRCGALVAGEEFIRQTLKVQDSMIVCQPRPAQLALQYGCRHLDDWVLGNADIMRQRHNAFKEQFTAAATAFELSASGTFFAWVRHPWRELSGYQAARRLTDRAHIICLPGEAFGPGLGDYLRLAFGNLAIEQIPETVARFVDLE